MKVFIIGFNKCGTRTIHHFFMKNGLRSIHWDKHNLVNTLEDNLRLGRPLLEKGRTVNTAVNSDCLYSDANVFSDMTSPTLNKDPKDYYKRLDRDYPGSKFILNVRDVDAWVSSRKRHANGRFLNQQMDYHRKSEAAVEDIWRQAFADHVKDTAVYFADRPEDFLVFHLETDGPEKIIDFLADDFHLDARHWDVVA